MLPREGLDWRETDVLRRLVDHRVAHTVPAFNFCTKCMGIPDITHDRTPDCHPVSRAWIGKCMTSQLNVVLICKLRRSLVCLAYFSTCYPWMCGNQALADARSTGAEIQCLYFRSTFCAYSAGIQILYQMRWQSGHNSRRHD